MKELANSKGNYVGEFKFDSIPRYFPNEKVLTKSWEAGQGFTDAFVSGQLMGFPGKRYVKDIFACYKTFFGKILQQTEEKLEKIKRNFEEETKMFMSIDTEDHYKHFGNPGPGVFVVQNTHSIVPIEPLIRLLEKVECAIEENESEIAKGVREGKIYP